MQENVGSVCSSCIAYISLYLNQETSLYIALCKDKSYNRCIDPPKHACRHGFKLFLIYFLDPSGEEELREFSIHVRGYVLSVNLMVITNSQKIVSHKATPPPPANKKQKNVTQIYRARNLEKLTSLIRIMKKTTWRN